MRRLVSVCGGLAAALALFALMDRLIAADDAALLDTRDGAIVDFVRLLPEEQVQRKQRTRPPRPKPPKKRPPPPRLPLAKVEKPVAQPLDAVPPPIRSPVVSDGDPFIGGPGAAKAPIEGDVIPLVRIAPRYPREARLRGTEGWVKVRFTINEDGTVAAPSVIESEPRRVFDREAVRAILRWKFKPRVVDGVPVKREAEQVIEFSMGER